MTLCHAWTLSARPSHIHIASMAQKFRSKIVRRLASRRTAFASKLLPLSQPLHDACKTDCGRSNSHSHSHSHSPSNCRSCSQSAGGRARPRRRRAKGSKNLDSYVIVKRKTKDRKLFLGLPTTDQICPSNHGPTTECANHGRGLQKSLARTNHGIPRPLEGSSDCKYYG